MRRVSSSRVSFSFVVAASSRVMLSTVLFEESSDRISLSPSEVESEDETMSGNGTAVGAGVGVGERDAVGEGDASCACAPNAEHSNSRPTSSKAARRESVIVSVIPQSLGVSFKVLNFGYNLGYEIARLGFSCSARVVCVHRAKAIERLASASSTISLLATRSTRFARELRNLLSAFCATGGKCLDSSHAIRSRWKIFPRV